MDWGRYLRAMEAARMGETEARRDAQIAGNAKLSPDEWEAVKEHDALLEDDDGDSES
jgi:hypothetical protein